MAWEEFHEELQPGQMGVGVGPFREAGPHREHPPDGADRGENKHDRADVEENARDPHVTHRGAAAF